MMKSNRKAKSFTIEPEVDRYVDTTKGEQSASARVNELLKRAILQEKYEQLEAEAESFFADAGAQERAGTTAFQKAALRSFEKD